MSVKPDGFGRVVASVYMDRSIGDFVRACTAYLEEEQAKLAPDTHLIALVCDALRLTREMRLCEAEERQRAREDYAALEADFLGGRPA